MSGRKRIYVLTDTLYEEMKNTTLQYVRDKADKKHKISEEDSIKVAEEVAKSSMIYSLLVSPLRKVVDFDVAKAVNPKGNTGDLFFMQSLKLHQF
jgi:arginyl-tRNA synthetase